MPTAERCTPSPLRYIPTLTSNSMCLTTSPPLLTTNFPTALFTLIHALLILNTDLAMRQDVRATMSDHTTIIPGKATRSAKKNHTSQQTPAPWWIGPPGHFLLHVKPKHQEAYQVEHIVRLPAQPCSIPSLEFISIEYMPPSLKILVACLPV